MEDSVPAVQDGSFGVQIVKALQVKELGIWSVVILLVGWRLLAYYDCYSVVNNHYGIILEDSSGWLGSFRVLSTSLSRWVLCMLLS